MNQSPKAQEDYSSFAVIILFALLGKFFMILIPWCFQLSFINQNYLYDFDYGFFDGNISCWRS